VRRAAVAVALIAAFASTAWPCPAPPPDDDGTYRCTKTYGRDPIVVPQVDIYVRDEPGALPKRGKRVMRHLTSSGWHARADQASPETLQVFDAANVPDTYEAIDGARQVLIRSIAKVERRYQVTLDDGTFEVKRCKERKRTRTCLVRVQ